MHSNETQVNIENLRDAEFKILLEESQKKLEELTARSAGKPSLLQLAQQNQNLDVLELYYQTAFNYFSLFGVDYTSAYDSNVYRRTILYWAIACFKDGDTLEKLISQGSKADEAYYDNEDYSLISAFSIALQLRNKDAIRVLLKHCPDLVIEKTYDHGDMPAHYAAQQDAVDILEDLYNVNPDITHIPTGPLDIAPLHTAAIAGRTHAARWILEHDPQTCNLANATGYTPLHYAVVNSHPEMVALLLTHGADISLKTKSSPKSPEKTALQLAADAGNNDIVRILLKHKSAADDKQLPDYSAVIKHLQAAPVNPSKLNENTRITFALLDYVDGLSKRKGEYLNTIFGYNPNPYGKGSVKGSAAKKIIRNQLNNEADPFTGLSDEEFGALTDKYSRDEKGLRSIVLPLLNKYRPGSNRASPVTPNKLSPQMRTGIG